MINIPEDFKMISTFITGSNLYGNATKDSDIDTRGVFIPSKEYFYGFSKRVEQFEDKVNDIVFHEIKKFFKLAIANNPNIVEYLFIPIENHLLITDEWKQILDNRDYFISKKCKFTFSGYAHSQFKRIKRHRSWLLNPPKKKPERSEFGLPENQSLVPKDQIGAFNILLSLYLEQIGKHHKLREQLEEMEETTSYISLTQNLVNIDYKVVKQILPVSDNMIDALEREKGYLNAIREWNAYNRWKKNRNPERAILEKKFGYDCKHASHLYRLMTEGEELLTTGKITFPRPDAEFLTQIKNGSLTFDELMSLVSNYDNLFDDLYDKSKLQYSPNIKKLDQLCEEINENYLRNF